MSAPILAVLEVHDRSAGVLARLPVTHWPVTVGRSLACDLVVDDAHVAAEHLRIDRPEDGGPAHALVLDTVNGVSVGSTHYAAGAELQWMLPQWIQLGRLRLTLRLADTPLPPELPLTHLSWRNTVLTLASVGLLLGWMLGLLWLTTPETEKFAQALPVALTGMLGAIGVWCGLSALASKLFSGHAQFWRHVRIACSAVLAEALVAGAVNLLGFMFSWEGLARFDYLIGAPILAFGIYLQLAVIAPHHKKGLRLTVVVLFVAAVAANLGNNWLQTKRLVGQKQLSSLFPPTWRVASPVPVAQFMEEAQAIRQQLDERLKEDPTSDGDASDDDGD